MLTNLGKYVTYPDGLWSSWAIAAGCSPVKKRWKLTDDHEDHDNHANGDDDDDDGDDDDDDGDIAHPGSLQFVTLCSSVKARLKVAFKCLVKFFNFSFRLWFLFSWIGRYLHLFFCLFVCFLFGLSLFISCLFVVYLHTELFLTMKPLRTQLTLLCPPPVVTGWSVWAWWQWRWSLWSWWQQW